MISIKKIFRIFPLLCLCIFLYFNPLVADTTPPSDQIQQESPDFPLTPESPPPILPISYEDAFIKMIVAVIALMAFVLLTVWVLRKLGRGKFGGFGSSRSIHIIEKKLLSPKSVLYLVEVDSKRFLIAESQLEIRQLGAIEPLSDNTP